MKKYDVLIIGAGPGGIYSAYELTKRRPDLKVAVFEAGNVLEKRKCPIDGDKIKSCIGCKTCSIMNGFGGAGAFSDGKYNITNDFGGTLYEYIGRKKAIELMEYVDRINLVHGGEGTKLYSTAGTRFRKICVTHGLNLLNASVRHLGTDINYIVLKNLFEELKDRVDFYFNAPVEHIEKLEHGYKIHLKKEKEDAPDEQGAGNTEKTAGNIEKAPGNSAKAAGRTFQGRYCIVSAGRSGSKWMGRVCKDLQIPTKSNRVDIGVRVEIPAVVFEDITNELYESKIVYRTQKFEDRSLQ